MLKFIANLFHKKPVAPTAPAPYKVEAAQAVVPPVRAPKPVKEAKQSTAKKTTRKPKSTPRS